MGCGVSAEEDLQERGGGNVALSEVAASAHMLEEILAGACGRSSVGSTNPSLAYYSNASSRKKRRGVPIKQHDSSKGCSQDSNLGGRAQSKPSSKTKSSKNPLSTLSVGGDVEDEEDDDEDDVATIQQLEWEEELPIVREENPLNCPQQEQESHFIENRNEASNTNNNDDTVERNYYDNSRQEIESSSNQQQQQQPFFQRNSNNTNFNTIGNTLVLQHLPMRLPPHALSNAPESRESSNNESSSGGSGRSRQQQQQEQEQLFSQRVGEEGSAGRRPLSHESGSKQSSTNSGSQQEVPNMFSCVFPPATQPPQSTVPSSQHPSQVGAPVTTPRTRQGTVQATNSHIPPTSSLVNLSTSNGLPEGGAFPLVGSSTTGVIGSATAQPFSDMFQNSTSGGGGVGGPPAAFNTSSPAPLVSGAPRGDRNSPPVDEQRIVISNNNSQSQRLKNGERQAVAADSSVDRMGGGGGFRGVPPPPPPEEIPRPGPHIALVEGAITFDKDREASALQMRRSKQKTIQSWMAECHWPVTSIPPGGGGGF